MGTHGGVQLAVGAAAPNSGAGEKVVADAGAGDVEMSIQRTEGGGVFGGSADFGSVEAAGEPGEITVRLRVERTAISTSEEGLALCPEGASTGVKKVFSDVSFYEQKSDNQVCSPLPRTALHTIYRSR